MLKKIWKDPVWSKVISVGIIAVISLIYTKIMSIVDKISFKQALQNLLYVEVKLIYVVIVAIAFIFIRLFFKRKKGYYTPKQEKLRSFNRFEDDETGILFKWDVFFEYNNTPFIRNLTCFCTKHGQTPIRLINNSCTILGCKNSSNSINTHGVKNYIESELIAKWDKLK